MTNALGDDPGVTACIAQAVEDLEQAGAQVDEVEIPDLFDLIVATSMYTDRSKHDLDLFLSELETRRSASKRPTTTASTTSGWT